MSGNSENVKDEAQWESRCRLVFKCFVCIWITSVNWGICTYKSFILSPGIYVQVKCWQVGSIDLIPSLPRERTQRSLETRLSAFALTKFSRKNFRKKEQKLLIIYMLTRLRMFLMRIESQLLKTLWAGVLLQSKSFTLSCFDWLVGLNWLKFLLLSLKFIAVIEYNRWSAAEWNEKKKAFGI